MNASMLFTSTPNLHMVSMKCRVFNITLRVVLPQILDRHNILVSGLCHPIMLHQLLHHQLQAAPQVQLVATPGTTSNGLELLPRTQSELYVVSPHVMSAHQRLLPLFLDQGLVCLGLRYMVRKRPARRSIIWSCQVLFL